MRRDVRIFPAFADGPREFYERGVLESREPRRPEPHPTAPERRPRNFVQCLPAFAICVLPVGPA